MARHHFRRLENCPEGNTSQWIICRTGRWEALAYDIGRVAYVDPPCECLCD